MSIRLHYAMPFLQIQTKHVEYVYLGLKMVSHDYMEMLMVGRLISPCRCRGTMKFVHLSCLNSWRYASPNARSVYQCDQCGYKYNFNRTQYAAFVSNLYTRVTPLPPLRPDRVLIVARCHIHIIRSRGVYLWIHLQIHPLCNGGISPLHTNILPPRPPLRHRPHRRNVFL